LDIPEQADPSGKIIKLGDFGTFRTTLSGEGVAEESEFTVSKLKS
jgi:hypothetical protein